jgi:2-C-methyl-D-erythritol 4-phosphate cytidylyltransferase
VTTRPPATAADELASDKARQKETSKKEDIIVTYDSVRPAAVPEVTQAVMAEQRREIKAVLTDRAAMPAASISGRIISSEDDLPLPGATI